jgi:hypothetical protein
VAIGGSPRRFGLADEPTRNWSTKANSAAFLTVLTNAWPGSPGDWAGTALATGHGSGFRITSRALEYVPRSVNARADLEPKELIDESDSLPERNGFSRGL